MNAFKQTGKPVKPVVSQPLPITDEQHLAAIDVLKEKCYELKFVIGRLPTSRKADKKSSETIAKTVGGTRKGIRTSWSLFSDEHPAVAELNGALSALAGFRDSFASVEDSKKAGVAAVNESEEGRKKSVKEGGKRLIWADDHKELYDKIVILSDRVAACAVKVQAAIDEIKAADRAGAGSLWNESAYPSDVRLIVGVPKDADGNYIVDFSPTINVPESLHPEIKVQVIKRAEMKLSGSLEVAVESAVKQLNAGLTTFMSELVNRTRISPRKGSKYEYLNEHGQAEVLKTVIHEQDKSVPPGHVRAYVAYKSVPEGETYTGPESLEVIKKWIGPMPEKTYHSDLMPQTTDEKKKIYPTVIEGLISRMQEFRDNQAKLLGAHGDNVNLAFSTLLETLNKLKRLGDDNAKLGEKVAKQCRADEDFKSMMAETIADTVEALDNAVVEVKKVRRRINTKLIVDIDE